MWCDQIYNLNRLLRLSEKGLEEQAWTGGQNGRRLSQSSRQGCRVVWTVAREMEKTH